MTEEQIVRIDAWALEWLLGSAKRELETCTDETRKHWLTEAVARGERAWSKWASPYSIETLKGVGNCPDCEGKGQLHIPNTIAFQSCSRCCGTGKVEL